MERPIFKPVGTPVEELDTPTLVVDLAVLERNIETMHSVFHDADAKLRPRVDSHGCPEIAHRQLDAGETVGGICVATVGQAEAFCENGIGDILVANVVVTPQKINRLCTLARQAKIAVAVDNATNVRDLSDAAVEARVNLEVVVIVNPGSDHLGVEAGQPAVDLARAATDADGVDFSGLTMHEDPIGSDDSEDLAAESRKRIQRVLNTREMIEKIGVDVTTVCVGGTNNYEVAASMAGVTEVPAGSYTLMDQRYRRHRQEFQPAARIISTVTSATVPGHAVCDAGAKAIGCDLGDPSIDNVPGATVRGLNAEHGEIYLDGSDNGQLDLGDKVWFTPWDIGTCINLHDYLNVVRDGKLKAVWSIPTRGRYR